MAQQNSQKTIEQYLNRATFGLWGKKRQEVRTELYSHIYEHMHHQMAFGKTEAEALQLALAQLGDARTVRTGLVKTHTLPGLGKALLLTGLLSAAVISQAQQAFHLNVITETRGCEQQDFTCLPMTLESLSYNEFSEMLHRQGVRVALEDHQQDPQPAAELTIGTQKIRLSYQNVQDRDALIRKKGEDRIFTLYLLLQGLLSNPETHMKGLINPEISIGGAKFVLGTEARPYDASQAYRALLGQSLGNDHNISVAFRTADEAVNPIKATFHMEVPRAKDGEVYALLQHVKFPLECSCTADLPKTAFIHLAEAKHGTVTFPSLFPEAKFADFDHLHEGDVLLKLSGEFQNQPYQVVQPGKTVVVPL